jgi:anion-transporting  ArsA/GET3 family ATPase
VTERSTLDDLIGRREVVICAGPGGVGKTTCAAAIALHGARAGLRSCVVTIDPAKRLGDALGVASLDNEPHSVDLDPPAPPGGGLWALMLDTKSTFDEVVTRYSASGEQAQAILSNRLYRNISGVLGGTQEYMAMEKLYELHSSGLYDLIVVDTPPTRHALDFMDAPARLMRFLDNRVFRLLMSPTRVGLRAIGAATNLLLRAVSKVVGGAVVNDAVAFFTAFEGMEQGFRERAANVSALLDDPRTGFVVVTTPRREAVNEAVFFADRLTSSSDRVDALIANRMFPSFGALPSCMADALANEPDIPGQDPGSYDLSRRSVEARARILMDFEQISSKEERHIAELAKRLTGTTIVRVPFLSEDVHDLTGLDKLQKVLFSASPQTDPGDI